MSAAAPPAAPRWLQLWARYRHWLAVLSFAAGVASFLLVQRQERVAQALIVLLPLSWLIAIAESQWLRQRRSADWLRHSQALIRYLNQAIHQEAFFFTLPFFLATTTWGSTQALFVSVLALLALASMIDPIYFGRIAVRTSLLWFFHSAATFITVLAAAPMLWQISAATSLQLAIASGALVSIPMFAALLPRLRWPLACVCAIGLAVMLWSARSAIPPATLSVFDAHASLKLDAERREPGAAFDSVRSDLLTRYGVYIWTPIHAPRGLAETIEHQWWHNGVRVDRIPIEIRGGRNEGYRAWTHKTAFPADPRGRWQVRVVTQSDQLIGLVNFTVH